MLSIAEVAILADLDERMNRNATSKSAQNRLETELINSTVYIPRLAALEWLKSKRGFIPTTFENSAFGADFLERNKFANVTQVGEFIRMKREEFNLDHATLAGLIGSSLTKEDLLNLETGAINVSESDCIQIGNGLQLNGELFALRVLEAIKQEELQTLQARLALTI